MTEQPVYVPPKKKNVGLWLTVGLVVVIGVVAFVFAESPPPRPVADASLNAGLLGAADFPDGFYVSNMTQDELDQASRAPGIPDTVNPAECSELLRDTARPPGGQSVAMVQASDATNGVSYVQAILKASEASLDLAKAEAMLTVCREITFTVPGRGTVTVHTSRIDGVEGEGYARSVATGEEFGIGGFILSAAVTKVEDHVVMFLGVGAYSMRGWTLDEAEFVRLANAANERVRSVL